MLFRSHDLSGNHNHFIVGDNDGVVVIPREVMPQVLERAEEVVHTENEVRKAILEGVHPVEAYRKHGRF